MLPDLGTCWFLIKSLIVWSFALISPCKSTFLYWIAWIWLSRSVMAIWWCSCSCLILSFRPRGIMSSKTHFLNCFPFSFQLLTMTCMTPYTNRKILLWLLLAGVSVLRTIDNLHQGFMSPDNSCLQKVMIRFRSKNWPTSALLNHGWLSQLTNSSVAPTGTALNKASCEDILYYISGSNQGLHWFFQSGRTTLKLPINLSHTQVVVPFLLV